MKEITQSANAKLNLTLDVLGKRSDGYHDVRMILQSVDLCDDVTVAIDTHEWNCSCGCENIPDGEENLAMRAARAFLAESGKRPVGVSIRIVKRIPSQAGLGGGSADAAAVLRALNTLYDNIFSENDLMKIGATVGSDVPFCVIGGTALAEGRGEQITALHAAPECAYLFLKPDFSASTPELYAAIDRTNSIVHPDTDGMIDCISRGDLNGMAGMLSNVFLPVLNAIHPVEPLCRRLLDAGALGASLSGSGSVVYGVFRNSVEAEKAAERFRNADLLCYIAKNAT